MKIEMKKGVVSVDARRTLIIAACSGICMGFALKSILLGLCLFLSFLTLLSVLLDAIGFGAVAISDAIKKR